MHNSYPVRVIVITAQRPQQILMLDDWKQVDDGKTELFEPVAQILMDFNGGPQKSR